MKSARTTIGRCAPFLVLAGCVGTPPTGGVDQARALASEAFPLAAPAESADASANAVTIDTCVTRAWDHSLRVREALARVGVAEADWSSTVLPRDPELLASALFPLGGGDPELEAALALDLLDVLRIPARRDVADAALRAAIFDVARECVARAREAQTAFVRALAADESVAARERIAQSARDFADAIDAQVTAGVARSTQADVARLAAAEAELARDAAKVEARAARRDLAQCIGHKGEGSDLELAPFTPADPTEPSAADIDEALERRLDLKALAGRVDEARAALELAGGVLPSLGVGVGVVRPEQPDGADRQPARVGPSITAPLPWFGKSAARVAAAQAELELRQAELESARSNARRELRDQWDRQSQATAEWHRRERELEPKARELAERASEAARSGQLPWTEAHAAREAAQEAMLALIESRRRARSASVDLRGALGRR